MTYTWIDAVVLVIFALSILFAWARGFVREIMGIISWLIAIIIGVKFGHLVVPMIKDLPIINTSCQITAVAGAVIVFIIVMILFALLTPFASGMMRNNFLSVFDSALGALFGFFRGLVLVILLILVYDNVFSATQGIPAISNSMSYSIFTGPSDEVGKQLPSEDEGSNWIITQFENLTADCNV